MPSPALLEAHRAEVSDITALAQAALVGEWGDLPLDDVAATKSALTGVVTDVVGDYGLLAAGAGADFYTEARHEAGARGRVRQKLVVPVIAQQIASGVGWSVGPLFGVADKATALARASGLVQRLTTNAERATLYESGRRDAVQVRWYRGTSANACAFCALIASRAVGSMHYRSQETAGFDSHNNCRCFPVPVFGSEKPDLPDYYQGFYDEYVASATKVADANGGKYPLRKVLKQMRVDTGRA